MAFATQIVFTCSTGELTVCVDPVLHPRPGVSAVARKLAQHLRRRDVTEPPAHELLRVLHRDAFVVCRIDHPPLQSGLLCVEHHHARRVVDVPVTVFCRHVSRGIVRLTGKPVTRAVDRRRRLRLPDDPFIRQIPEGVVAIALDRPIDDRFDDSARRIVRVCVTADCANVAAAVVLERARIPRQIRLAFRGHSRRRRRRDREQPCPPSVRRLAHPDALYVRDVLVCSQSVDRGIRQRCDDLSARRVHNRAAEFPDIGCFDMRRRIGVRTRRPQHDDVTAHPVRRYLRRAGRR